MYITSEKIGRWSLFHKIRLEPKTQLSCQDNFARTDRNTRYKLENLLIEVIAVELEVKETHVCGCDGSSPSGTVSPGLSLKHLTQNV